MIDQALLGQTAAKCMEELDSSDALDGGEITAVGIIVSASTLDGKRSVVRTYMSDELYYRQLGILHAGIDCVTNGAGRYSPDESDDE